MLFYDRPFLLWPMGSRYDASRGANGRLSACAWVYCEPSRAMETVRKLRDAATRASRGVLAFLRSPFASGAANAHPCGGEGEFYRLRRRSSGSTQSSTSTAPPSPQTFPMAPPSVCPLHPPVEKQQLIFPGGGIYFWLNPTQILVEA